MDCTDLTSVDFEELLRANLPAGALVDGSTSGHCEADERLQAAAAAAAERGTATPLLKEELRLRILERRMKAGKPEIKPDAAVPKEFEVGVYVCGVVVLYCIMVLCCYYSCITVPHYVSEALRVYVDVRHTNAIL